MKGDKREAKPKIEISTDGNALSVKAFSDITCYGNNVTTTPRQRVYERQGVDPKIGLGIGIASAALFGVTFASGICNPDDPRLFDFNQDDGVPKGISTSQTTCDLVTAGGTLIGFSGALAYGATSVKMLTTSPDPQMLDPEQKSEATSEACGTQPIPNEPIAVYFDQDKTLSYGWTDESGVAKFDLSTLIDPSVQGGAKVAFARDANNPLASITEDQSKSLRAAGWAPLGKQPPTGEAQFTRAHFEVTEVNADVRRVTLYLKVQNITDKAGSPKSINVRAKLVSKDTFAVNGRTVLWENLAVGADSEKVVTVDLPKEIAAPTTFDVFLINKDGVAIAKVTAKTGPEEPLIPPTPPAPKPSATEKAVVDQATGQILIYEQVKFANGKATIDPSSNALLDSVAKVLNDNKQIKKIRVEGHTDDKGVATANEKLSNDRAAAVVKYLTSKKVEAARLVAKGYGAGCPMVENSSDENRAQNRRVEFVILGEKDDPKGVCRVQMKK